MNITKMNKLDKDEWKEIRSIVLFGYGRQGKRLYKALKSDFEIPAIVENDVKKGGKTEDGTPIISFSDASDVLNDNKIIVTTAEYHYKEIKKQLMEAGLEEYKDFVMYQQFVSEWYYEFKQKIYLLKTDIMVTPACSLNCENCSQFVPYWKDREPFSLECLKQDLDRYFSCVDYVMDMNIVGGEPLLYKELDEYIDYIGTNYRNKIGYLGIITNGTIIPRESTLDRMKRFDIGVSISDYSKEVPYSDKIDKLCEILEHKEISYVRNIDIQWFDFGFPKKTYNYSEVDCPKHMENCNTICHCLHDKKVYYCGTAWAAERAGIFPKDENGYVDLEKIDVDSMEDKRRILECCLGNIESGYLKFCKVCGGYGNDNDNRVITGKQCSRKNV